MANGSRKPADRRVRAAVQKLEDLQRAGITHLPKARRSTRSGGAASPAVAPAAAANTAPAAPPASLPVVDQPVADSAESRAVRLAQLAARVAKCTRCAELARTRTQTVFGDGSPCAKLVFMGEAPGADEDRQGKPFVGAAGQKLTEIIVNGMKLRREEVYILNTIKCRPPGNRAPLPEEAANCREYLDQQLAILQPQYICCLGAVASQNLLGTEATIGRLRGRVHDYHGIKVVCTYHPAYLLRNPSARADVWEDVKRLMSEMGLKVTK